MTIEFWPIVSVATSSEWWGLGQWQSAFLFFVHTSTQDFPWEAKCASQTPPIKRPFPISCFQLPFANNLQSERPWPLLSLFYLKAFLLPCLPLSFCHASDNGWLPCYRKLWIGSPVCFHLDDLCLFPQCSLSILLNWMHLASIPWLRPLPMIWTTTTSAVPGT